PSSAPFFTSSSQTGTWHTPSQTSERQSALTVHVAPSSQGGHEPPHPSEVSSPSRTPLLQVATSGSGLSVPASLPPSPASMAASVSSPTGPRPASPASASPPRSSSDRTSSS